MIVQATWTNLLCIVMTTQQSPDRRIFSLLPLRLYGLGVISACNTAGQITSGWGCSQLIRARVAFSYGEPHT